MCAEAGLRVVLAYQHLSNPAPDESLLPGCSLILARLSLADAMRSANFTPFRGIYANGVQTIFSGPQGALTPGWHVMRPYFDALLRSRAKAMGVKVLQVESDFVRRALRFQDNLVRSIGTDFAAQWIIDGSGRRGLLGHRLKLKQRHRSPRLIAWRGAVAMRTSSAREAGFAQFTSNENGWFWYAQTRPGHWVWTSLGKGSAKPKLPAEFADAPILLEPSPWNVAWRIYRPVVGLNWVLAGDAAAVIDPAAANGVFFALQSGVAAAKTVIRCCQNPKGCGWILAEYDRWISDSFARKTGGLAELYTDLRLFEPLGMSRSIAAVGLA